MAFDAIVVGTGIIGSFTAMALHERGLRVAVVDRGGLAPGTSRSSDGNLLCSDKSSGLMLTLSQRSLQLWRRYAERYGNECELDFKGSTVVARGHEQAAALRAFVASHQVEGIDCEFRDRDWRDLEPELGPDTSAVGHWPGDAQVQPMLACYQIARQLQNARVPYFFYQPMVDIEPAAGGVAITLGDGTRLQAGHLCVCAGVWTNEALAPLGVSIPVRPRKGHICVLERGDVGVNSKIADFGYNAAAESTEVDDDRLQTAAVIESTQSGTILCGSSREFAGFDRAVSTEVMRRILADCIGVVPALARLRVIRGYAGLRPFSPDGHPIIGPVDDSGRVIVATGHEGAGHGLAPITGELVAGYIADGVSHPYQGRLHPERFAS
jgi:glycine/D-amino acid oxidase-like deaminating enzyme